MTYQNLLIQEENSLLILTINRPEALNALNSQTINELYHFFNEDAPNRNIKGVIITGSGEKSFIAGADIKEFLALDAEKGASLARKGQHVFFLIEKFNKPVIAAVNGFALGGGCELAMACHLRIAGEKARFGQPEVNLGIIPGYGGTQRLIQYIGKTKTTELLMTGDMFNADKAYHLGLVNYIVPQGQEVTKAKEILSKIAQKAPIAIAKIIECVNAYHDVNVDGFEVEVKSFGQTAGTQDFKEGATAFLEKRKAVFKGE